MTPQQFIDTYGPYANIVGGKVGIDPQVLVAQWGVETAWGNLINNQNNLGNIRCFNGAPVPCSNGFLQFPTVLSFCATCEGVWQEQQYAAVLAANGDPEAQIEAICSSPWSSDHYGGPGLPNHLETAWEVLNMSILSDIFKVLGGDNTANFLGWSRDIKAELDSVKVDVEALKASGITVDLSTVNTRLDTMETALVSLGTQLSRIENALKSA